MKVRETRKYEMLLRVDEFGRSQRDSFPPSSAAHEVFAAVSAAIEELAAADVQKRSALVSSRADEKAAARTALSELLMRVSQLAQVFRARGRTLPAFEIPESRSDQTLLTVARQFARDAAMVDAEFTAHGMGPAQIATVTARFEEAIRDRMVNRAGHVAARARIQELLSQALLDVRRLDLIIGNELGNDRVIRTVWKQVRRVLKSPSAAEAPVTVTDADAAHASIVVGAALPLMWGPPSGRPDATAEQTRRNGFSVVWHRLSGAA